MLAEALKMRISQLRREGKQDIRVIVSPMKGSDGQLMKDLQEKYLPDIARESFIKLTELFKENNVKSDSNPHSILRKILSSLSAEHSLSHKILHLDEVWPNKWASDWGGNVKADWSSFTSCEDVDFLLALSTFSNHIRDDFFTVIPPSDEMILCQRLSTPHRNCREIEIFFKYFIQHRLVANYIAGTEEDQQASDLPPGRLPVWIQRSPEVTDVQVLEFIKENNVADTKLGVTLLQFRHSTEVEIWCNEHSWKCVHHDNMTGSEDQCIVVVGGGDTVSEQIGRARNLLVIVTEHKIRRDRCKTIQLLVYEWREGQSDRQAHSPHIQGVFFYFFNCPPLPLKVIGTKKVNLS